MLVNKLHISIVLPYVHSGYVYKKAVFRDKIKKEYITCKISHITN